MLPGPIGALRLESAEDGQIADLTADGYLRRLELNAELFVRHRHKLDDGERVPPLEGIEPLLASHGSRWERSRRFEFGKKLGECHRVKNSRQLKGPLRTFRPNK